MQQSTEKHTLTEGARLTKWKHEPTLVELKRDFTESERSHAEQMSRINRWLDNLYIRNAAKIKTKTGNSSVVPKLIRKQAEWRYAALSEPFLSTTKLLQARPKTWEDVKNAAQCELLLNHFFNTAIDRVKFIDEYVRTGVDEGTIIMRTGWEYAEHEVEEDAPVYEFYPDPALAQVFQDITVLEEENPTGFFEQITDGWLEAYRMFMETGEAYRPEQVGTEKITVTKTLKNQPTVDICDSNDVLIDPSCNGDISKAQFVIYRFTSSLSDLTKAGMYKNLDQINVKDASLLQEPDDAFTSDRSFNFSDDPRKKFTVYEYWGFRDIDGDGVVEPFVASWVGNTLIRMEENPYPDNELPFVVVPYLPVRKHIYGEPDGELLEDNQKIMGAVTRGMIDIMAKSANSQTGIRKGVLDPLNRRKFLAGDDYEFNSNGDPRQAIYMHTFPEIPASAQVMLQMQNMEAESLTGVKAFNQGISGQSLGQVAAGVRGALDAASKREAGILRRMSNGITEVARKWLAMSAVFLEDDVVVRITNDTFGTIRPDDIKGHFDIELEISTAEENNAQAQELAFMLQTMGNNLDFEVTKIILKKIADLRRMPDVAKAITDYQPQPDPMQQQIQMLELEKLKAEIGLLQGRAAEAQTGAMLDQAKAQNLQSDTDLKNLDFVEQESGVKQERDLQKQQAQAMGNIELEREKVRLGTAQERLNKFFA